MGKAVSYAGKVANWWIRHSQDGWKKWLGVARRDLRKRRLSPDHLAGWVMLGLGFALWFLSYDLGWGIFLSYTFLMIMAVSWASFFRQPLIFILGYVAIAVRKAAIDSLAVGDWTEGAIILAMALYLTLESRRDWNSWRRKWGEGTARSR